MGGVKGVEGSKLSHSVLSSGKYIAGDLSSSQFEVMNVLSPILNAGLLVGVAKTDEAEHVEESKTEEALLTTLSLLELEALLLSNRSVNSRMDDAPDGAAAVLVQVAEDKEFFFTDNSFGRSVGSMANLAILFFVSPECKELPLLFAEYFFSKSDHLLASSSARPESLLTTLLERAYELLVSALE